jgi:arylsulfatase A
MPTLTRRAFLGTTAALAVAQPRRPNFIVILTDDHGWTSGSYRMHPDMPESGSDYLETPNMARLAGEGMRFTSGYSPAPLCTPTRRSIHFGMTPARQRGTEFVGDFKPDGKLTLPQALRQADSRYRCAHFGKWGESMTGPAGLIPDNPANPTALGYDENDGVTGNVTGGMGADNQDRFHYAVKDDPKLISALTRKAVSFMERQVKAGGHFYLQVSHYAVHRQIQCKAETLEKYRRKGTPPRQFTHQFAAMLEDLDTGVGELLAAVDRLGIAGNTYVLLTADNGGTEYADAKHGQPVNHPLRASKQSLYEGGIRVPFIVRGPGVARNSWSHVPVAGYDILPTVYDLAGGKAPLPKEIDGGSFRNVLHNGGKGTVRRGLPGLLFHRPFLAKSPMSALRIGDHKLVIQWQTGARELYDLRTDIGEQNDLAPRMPSKVEEMNGILLSYLKAVGAEMPGERPRARRPSEAE